MSQGLPAAGSVPQRNVAAPGNQSQPQVVREPQAGEGGGEVVRGVRGADGWLGAWGTGGRGWSRGACEDPRRTAWGPEGAAACLGGARSTSPPSPLHVGSALLRCRAWPCPERGNSAPRGSSCPGAPDIYPSPAAAGMGNSDRSARGRGAGGLPRAGGSTPSAAGTPSALSRNTDSCVLRHLTPGCLRGRGRPWETVHQLL